MHTSNRIGKKNSWALAVAAGAVGISMALVGRADAAAIDVLLSRTVAAATPTIVNTVNPTVTIPAAPGVSYDAADTNDSGTIWNSLIAPNTANAVNNTSGATVTFTAEQNLPLVDSLNNSSPVSISSITFTENAAKNDTIHQTGVAVAGTDGLGNNPSALMGQSWFDNGTSETITFNLAGLTPASQYDLYVYGSGTNLGFGGTYTVPTANQGVGYNTAAGFYSTEPNASAIYHSVFDSTGTNPAPELGLSWNVLPVMADASGNLSFNVLKDNTTGIKGSINGFQIDAVPEPTTLGIVAFGAMALIGRRRK